MHKFKGTIILKELSNLSNIFEAYDTFVIDLWGVIHNGLALNPKAIEAIDQLKNNLKKLCFYLMLPDPVPK